METLAPYQLSGAYGCTISGAGPTAVAVIDAVEKGEEIGERMVEAFMRVGNLKSVASVKKLDKVGSIEGRVGVYHLDDSQQNKNFTFKCHRDGNEIYSVNALNFHPVQGTFATAGSDGAFNFWDNDSKQRLKAMSRCSQPIPCSSFNHDGSIYAYASCYDWSKGAENHNPTTAKSSIFLHLPQESEVKAKPRVATGRK